MNVETWGRNSPPSSYANLPVRVQRLTAWHWEVDPAGSLAPSLPDLAGFLRPPVWLRVRSRLRGLYLMYSGNSVRIYRGPWRPLPVYSLGIGWPTGRFKSGWHQVNNHPRCLGNSMSFPDSSSYSPECTVDWLTPHDAQTAQQRPKVIPQGKLIHHAMIAWETESFPGSTLFEEATG